MLKLAAHPYVFIELHGWTFWSRVKFAIAFMLTPFTIIFTGRSPEIMYKYRDTKEEEN